jgi:pyridoxal phosphate enzyme (YggS family)
MADPRAIVADNLARVRERIASAAIAAGRAPEAVRLVGVSKYVDVPTTAALIQAGCTDLGESRPQELWHKAAATELAGARRHLVGRLQRNKVRRTLPLVELIHSVDSERLLATIDEHATALDLSPRVLLEVNCSGETAKQGFSHDEIRRLAPLLQRYQRVHVTGLMTMAPLVGGEAAARESFASLHQLRDELNAATPHNNFSELSMGMSDDFEVAIAEGATLVRVGSLLFEGLA